MYSRKRRFTALILSVVMTISLLTGCSTESPQSQPEESVPVAIQTPTPTPQPTPAATPEPLREELFTKTVRDFEGYPVETFDDSGETNFIVYQKELKQLSRDEGINILVQADFDNQVFIFENPDENLLNCQPGQTFLLPNNETEANGFAFNVESSTVDGNTITINGSKPDMEDVFAYAEMNMDISLGQDASAEESSSEDSGTSESNDKVVVEHIPLGFPVSQHFNVDFGKVDVGADTSIVFESFHIEYYFFPEELYFYSNCWLNSSYTTSIYAGSEADFGTDIHDPLRFSFFKAPLPVPFGAAIGLQLDPVLELDFTGKISGKASWQGSSQNGFQFSCGILTELIVPHMTAIQRMDPKCDLEFEMEGTASIALDLKFFVGLKNVAEIYASPVVGMEFTGKPDKTAGKTEEGPDIDSVHDCDVCIDGDLESFASLNVGGKLCLTNGNKTIYPRIDGSIIRLSWFNRDFYISKIDNKLEWGFTECPNIRYRCTVEVGDKDRYKLSGAAVTAKYEDGRTESKTTGKDGYALVYLPYGAHVVTASKSGDQNSKVVTMGREPISVQISLNENKKIYFLYDIDKMNIDEMDALGDYIPGTIDDFPELKQLMLDNYPGIIFYNTSDGTRPEDIAPGDIIITYISKSKPWVATYGSSGTPDFMLYEGKMLCYNNGLTVYQYNKYKDDYYLFRSWWSLTSSGQYFDDPDFTLFYQVSDHAECNLSFTADYEPIHGEDIPGHNHSDIIHYTKANLKAGHFSVAISPETNSHFRRATVEHIKSIFPVIDAAMNEDWPVCKYMVQP